MTTSLERALADTLEEVERAAPEPPLDLVAMVREGMRQRHRRRLVAVSAAVAVAVVTVVAVAILPSARPQGGVANTPSPSPITVVSGGCAVHELAVPASFPRQPRLVTAVDVDPSGRYVVGSVADSTQSWAVLWVDGRPQVLGKDGSSVAVAVNAAGVVVGHSGVGGWVYRNGHISRLPILPGTSSTSPTAINSRGDIVGSSGARGVIWPADQPGQVHPITATDGTVSGVSDSGLIVGIDDGDHARLWNRDGTVYPLPPGFAYRPSMIAGPWVLGVADALGSDAGPVAVRYVLWNVTTGVIDQLAADSPTAGFAANALSESGALAGNFVDAGHRSQPAIFRNGEIILLPLPEGHSTTVVSGAITADGRTIVGTAGAQALLWQC
jgi:hypothetical protein